MRAVTNCDAAAEIVGKPKPTDPEIDKAVSMSIVRLRLSGYTYRAIADFHGITHPTAIRRYNAVPEHVRKRVLSLV